MLSSSTTIRIASGDDQHATLIVRCLGNMLEAYIAWPQLIGKDALDMRWRIDNGPIIAEVWSVSRDGSATFSEDTRGLLARLRTAQHATFQIQLANFELAAGELQCCRRGRDRNNRAIGLPGTSLIRSHVQSQLFQQRFLLILADGEAGIFGEHGEV